MSNETHHRYTSSPSQTDPPLPSSRFHWIARRLAGHFWWEILPRTSGSTRWCSRLRANERGSV